MLPSALPTPLTESAAHAALPESAGRILVVDDVHDNRNVLRRRLVKRNFTVIEAENGEEALKIIANEKLDLVLLDVRMPGLSGLEVLERIRLEYTSQQLPVIMVTANTFSDDVVAALQRGADDYVTKPVDFAVAIARINTQLARKRAAEELALRSREEEARRVEAERLVFRERAAKQKSEADNAFLTAHDALTGLANRAAFCEALASIADKRGVAFSVLFIDLDRFKAVNDIMGHLVGDQLLKLVAGRIREQLSDADCVARFGGDEFLILHRHPPGSSSAAELGTRVISTLCEPFSLQNGDVTIGASVGIACYSAPDRAAEALIGDADMAMYAAKNDGGNRIRIFDERLAEQIRRRTELELELQSALKRDEFTLVYQPIVNLGTSTVTSFEALLRWHHPQRGLISPAEFIPIAEETGLIVPIGEWVLREACRTAKSWPAEIKIAINLSSVQFRHGNIVATVMNALATTGLAPERLELEITESLVLTQSEENLRAIRQFRALGVRVAMDDFGTGYSSLSYLRDFEFDKIKVDQSFIRTLAHDEGSRAIISSISDLAIDLGITTTAEGVETQEQLDIVRTSGMTEVQGYYFGRPIHSGGISAAIAEASDNLGARGLSNIEKPGSPSTSSDWPR